MAVQYKQKEILQWLIDNGANLNLQTTNGDTPLHFGVKLAEPDLAILGLLLEHGANPNILDMNDRMPMWYAIKYLNLNYVKLLGAYGADLYKFCYEVGFNELVSPVVAGDQDITRYFFINRTSPSLQERFRKKERESSAF